MPPANWMDEPTRVLTLELFGEFGASGQISLVRTEDEDEAFFVLSPEGASKMEKNALTIALQELLHRKVWVVTDSVGWPEPIDPIGTVAA